MGDQGASSVDMASVPCCPECRQPCGPSRMSRAAGGIAGLPAARLLDEPVLACPCRRLELRSVIVREVAEGAIFRHLCQVERDLWRSEARFLRERMGLSTRDLAVAIGQCLDDVIMSETLTRGAEGSVIDTPAYWISSPRLKEVARRCLISTAPEVFVRLSAPEPGLVVDLSGIGLDGLSISGRS